METEKDFQELSNSLNEQINDQLKDKKKMKTLFVSTSKNSISRPSIFEKINIVFCLFLVLYFIPRLVQYKTNPFMLWTGIAATLLWAIMLVYSWIGYRKLASLRIGEAPIKESIHSLMTLMQYYELQRKIYLWFAPITIFVTTPIPLFEFRKIDLSILFNTTAGTIFITGTFVFATAVTIWVTKKFYDDHYFAPLNNAKEILEELEA